MLTSKVATRFWTHLNKLSDKPLTNALEIFLKGLIGRLKIEYRYFSFSNNDWRFETEWAQGTFFKITNEDIFELLF